jgi:hypothetical protein
MSLHQNQHILLTGNIQRFVPVLKCFLIIKGNGKQEDLKAVPVILSGSPRF